MDCLIIIIKAIIVADINHFVFGKSHENICSQGFASYTLKLVIKMIEYVHEVEPLFVL